MYTVIRLIAWFVWSVFGLLFWIPFLIRTMFGFNWTMVYATVTGNHLALAQARENLDFASALYVMGFRNIEQWTASALPETFAAPYRTTPADFKRFIWDVLWASLWWGLVFYPGVVSATIDAIGGYGFGAGWLIFAAGLGAGILVVQLFGNKKKKDAG